MEKKQHREEGSPAPDEFELKKQAEAYEALVLLVEKLVTVKARCESAINEQQLEKIAQVNIFDTKIVICYNITFLSLLISNLANMT